MTHLEMGVDLVVVAMLVTVLVLGVRLQRRLRSLRHDGGELKGLIDTLGAAVDRAEAVLSELKRASLEHATRCDDDYRRAERLRDDLAMLGGRADREADRLATLIGEVRGIGQDGAAVGPIQAAAQCTASRQAEPPESSVSGDLERRLRSLR